ncbi:MAG: metal-dependent hydrolase [Gemmatimonadota bacterium]
MATVAHLAAGALCGAVYARKASANSLVAVPLFAALALSPDLDFFAVQLGSDGTPFAHRAMTHAIPVGAVVGMALGVGFGRSPQKLWAGLLAFLALASHGILDAMTANAPGPWLWWPLTSAPLSFAWQPIPGTESWQEYFTLAAVPTLAVESLLSLPLVAAAGWVLWGPLPWDGGASVDAGGPGVRRPLPSSD